MLPSLPPDWWPALVDTDFNDSEIELGTAVVLDRVQDSVTAWGEGPYVVLAASGCLSQTNLRSYDLEVRAFFQRPEGPDRPTSQELIEELSSVNESFVRQTSPIRFGGSVDGHTVARSLGDWIVLPCSGPVNPTATIVWQSWRGMRGIQCPSTALSDNAIMAVCCTNSVNYEDQDGLIARWSDWSKGMSALAINGLQPASGWVLVAPRTVVERVSRDKGLNLAWAWQITNRFREHSFGDFLDYQMYGDRGASLVVRP